LLLVFAGAVTAGVAVSLRPDRWQSWCLGAAAAALAVPGVPDSWDSFKLLFAVLTLAALTGAVLAHVRRGVRHAVVSAMILFHFGGIFMAVTSPPPSPWLTEQLFTRVYNPYLQFMYLRNAYHFYSPEPGPASLLCFVLTTYDLKDKVGADGKPVLDGNGAPVKETLADVMALDPDARRKRVVRTEWVILPRRPADVRDPLGLTYYRRLSLTEQVARVYPGLLSTTEQLEKSQVWQRRSSVRTDFPLHPAEQPVYQYRVPNPDIARVLLPSYTSHVVLHYGKDADLDRTTVKMYRFEHRTLDVGTFTGKTTPDKKPLNPYHPSTYRPYYLGEYDVYGTLLDPQEPMLYWLVPVIQKPGGPAPGDPDPRDYIDTLSFHAGAEFDWRLLR
jgi:hypothetical protein